MAARKGALNAENLVALGPDRLASLLMEFAGADASVRKRLVLAVSESGGAAAVIKAADRRLNALANSRGHVDWEKARSYAADLDGLRCFIAESLTPLDPAAGAERLERFLELAPKVLERVDDSDGRIGAVFERVIADLGTAWGQVKSQSPQALAEKVLGFVVADRYGVHDGMIEAAAPALGDEGLAALGGLARKALAGTPAPADGRRYDWQRQVLQQVLAEVADAQGDVDAFIAVQTAKPGGEPDTLAISRRLLEAKRSEEALAWLDRETSRPGLRVMTYADLGTLPSASSRPPGLNWERETLRI